MVTYGIDPVITYLERSLAGILILSLPVQGPTPSPHSPPPDMAHDVKAQSVKGNIPSKEFFIWNKFWCHGIFFHEIHGMEFYSIRFPWNWIISENYFESFHEIKSRTMILFRGAALLVLAFHFFWLHWLEKNYKVVGFISNFDTSFKIRS